jgi:MFS family permease
VRTFYLILVTQTLSLVGSQMSGVALGIYVYTTTGKITPLLLVSFFNELPGMLGSSFAGVLVDRWDRRRVMLLADAGQAAVTVLLLAGFVSGRFELWMLYAAALAQGCFAILQSPAQNAAFTLLVPEDRRDRANGIREMAHPLAGVFAPALAGMLYAVAGVQGVIAVDLLTFGVAVAAIWAVTIPRPPVTAEGLAAAGGWLSELLGGLRYIVRRPGLFHFLFYEATLYFLLNGPLSLVLPYIIALTGSETLAGALLGVMSLGALAGAGLLAVKGRVHRRMATLLAGMAFCGVMFLFFGVGRSIWVLGVSLFLIMAPLPVEGALGVSMLQSKVPPDLQGRVFAVRDQLGYIGATLSFLLVGPLVDRVLEPAVGGPGWETVAPLVGDAPGSGMGLLLVITGALIIIVTGVAALMPEVRHLETRQPDYDGAPALLE